MIATSGWSAVVAPAKCYGETYGFAAKTASKLLAKPEWPQSATRTGRNRGISIAARSSTASASDGVFQPAGCLRAHVKLRIFFDSPGAEPPTVAESLAPLFQRD
jgi:hypothetical protein